MKVEWKKEAILKIKCFGCQHQFLYEPTQKEFQSELIDEKCPFAPEYCYYSKIEIDCPNCQKALDFEARIYEYPERYISTDSEIFDESQIHDAIRITFPELKKSESTKTKRTVNSKKDLTK